MKCSSEIVFLVLLAFGYGVHGGRDVTSKMCKKHDVMNVDANGRMQSVVEHTSEDLEATRTDGAQMQKGTPKSTSEDIIDDIFDRYDKNKDEKLSKAELRQYCAELNDMEDVEKDGAQMQEGTPKSTSEDLEEDGAQMQEGTPKSTSEDADSTNSFLDTNHTLSLAEKDPGDPFALPAGAKKCCCKEVPKYFICKRGKDAGRKIAPITKDGQQLCCKARSVKCDSHIPGASMLGRGGYEKEVANYMSPKCNGNGCLHKGVPNVDSCKLEGLSLKTKENEGYNAILTRQRSFNCPGPGQMALDGYCEVAGDDQCRSSNVKAMLAGWLSVGCKALVKAYCFFTQVLDGVIPGIRDTGVFNNALKSSDNALDKAILESEESLAEVAGVVGEVALGGLYAGTAYGILGIMFNACQGKFGSCSTGSKGFGVAIGITCIVFALTGVLGPASAVVFLAAAAGGPLISALGEDVCKLGWKCAAKKYLPESIATKAGFKAYMEKFLGASAGDKVAEILTGFVVKPIARLIDFAIRLMKTLLWSVLKLVYGILAFLPRVGFYAYTKYQGNMKSNATERNKQLCCLIERPPPEKAMENLGIDADKLHQDETAEMKMTELDTSKECPK